MLNRLFGRTPKYYSEIVGEDEYLTALESGDVELIRLVGTKIAQSEGCHNDRYRSLQNHIVELSRPDTIRERFAFIMQYWKTS